MRQHLRIVFIMCIAAVGAATAFCMVGSRDNRGKFCIVGMGTAPDVITIRGIETIKSADVILVGGREEQELWKDYTRDKEVWFCPNALRVLYGIDPRTITDPQKRRRAEDCMEARQALADKIRVAVRGGRIVAFLQGGDPMIFGQTFLLEMLPKDVPTEQGAGDSETEQLRNRPDTCHMRSRSGQYLFFRLHSPCVELESAGIYLLRLQFTRHRLLHHRGARPVPAPQGELFLSARYRSPQS